jgi:chromosome partitioning protein
MLLDGTTPMAYAPQHAPAPAAAAAAPERASAPRAPLTLTRPTPPPEVEPVVEDGIGPTGRPRPHFPEPAPLSVHGDGRVLAMCNQKGGVGKTTTTINLGAALAETGRRVLLVDFDPQGALSVGLGIDAHDLDLSIYDLLMRRGVAMDDVVLKTDVPGMDLLPANIDLSAAEVQLVTEVAREQVLARALAPARAEYDVVLIDCQPSLGLLTVNALTAADGVLVPLECEYFALRGVALLQDTIEKVRDRLNPDLEVDGLLATMYDARTVHAREVVARLVDAFGDRVFHTVIARTVRFPESTVAQAPITTYAPSSPGAGAYRQLARELLARWSATGAARPAGVR